VFGAALVNTGCRRRADTRGAARNDNGLAFEDHGAMVSEGRAAARSKYWFIWINFAYQITRLWWAPWQAEKLGYLARQLAVP
jgi:hypothetical protein